ncbi:uncharacterized protein AKAW2_40011S [Aspergillus luchuensis]|nr:uncharacterized protein AKAW2_40011S [Aspergillus luchuensis]BCR98328.1 hypothetical protein AKAW2_40011S [Aspergillus luchuensis]GAA90304.1 hypothetical protein AKAW_08418 [Aspergillus luchuensis IFO 4308]
MEAESKSPMGTNSNGAVYVSEGSWSHDVDSTAAFMKTLSCRTGFDANAGRVRTGVGTAFHSGREAREWLANLAESQLQKEDPAGQGWLRASISGKFSTHYFL